MKARVYNKNGSLAHSQNCAMKWGKKDPQCPRCVEMINGDAPRSGWQKDHFAMKKINDEMRLKSIKEHNCAKDKCAVVCTHGEW